MRFGAMALTHAPNRVRRLNAVAGLASDGPQGGGTVLAHRLSV